MIFLHTTNKLFEKEILKISSIIATEKIKYLGINLNIEMNDLYTVNYKTLMKGIKEDTDKSISIKLKIKAI